MGQLRDTVNAMVRFLQEFNSEVTRVALEVRRLYSMGLITKTYKDGFDKLSKSWPGRDRWEAWRISESEERSRRMAQLGDRTQPNGGSSDWAGTWNTCAALYDCLFITERLFSRSII